jgi:Protein of unknown function (DUF1566)
VGPAPAAHRQPAGLPRRLPGRSAGLLRKVALLATLPTLLLAATGAAGCGDDEAAGTRLHHGLSWQVRPEVGPLSRAAAATYCEQLELGDHTDWRLPSIDELRALITGCPGRERGGACNVTDPSCTNQSCWSAGTCGHCPFKQGPGEGGCYWTPGLWQGSCTETWFYWSATRFDRFSDHFWVVRFSGGGTFDDGVVGFNEELGAGSVRCVRRP